MRDRHKLQHTYVAPPPSLNIPDVELNTATQSTARHHYENRFIKEWEASKEAAKEAAAKKTA